MAENCTSCRYSQVDHDPDQGFDDGPLLRCHRYPPTVVSVGEELAQTFPNVGPDNWCGEHDPASPGVAQPHKEPGDG